MAEKFDDAVIFADTSEWGLMHVPAGLSSPEFALLAEKDLTNRVGQRRFEEDCAALVAEARKRETTSTRGYELPALRYARFGNLPACASAWCAKSRAKPPRSSTARCRWRT